MPPIVNLLDSSLGIQNIMDMPEAGALPRAREMAANVLNEAGLEELYAPSNARQYVETLLCPEVGDGSILSPEAFSSNIQSCIEALSGSGEQSVKELVTELKGLLRNGELYQAYVGLMIGG